MTRRVFWICEYARLNGAERSLLATLPGLREAGYEIAAVVPALGPLGEDLGRAGVPLVRVGWHDDAGRRIALDDIREQLEDIIHNASPDLVHANSLSMARVVGPVVEQLGIASIGHIRDIVGLSRTAMGDVNRNDRLLCVSAATRDFHVDQGLDASRAHVLFNGVDVDRFTPRPPTGWLHTELDIDSAAAIITTIGQIGARKGQDVLAAALPGIVAAVPDVHLVIVGERCSQKDEAVTFERSLDDTLDREGLADRVHFVGVREDVERILNETTVVVHAARQEPLGRVLLEAAASGKAIVATDVGGTAEIFSGSGLSVGRGESAILVPADDAGKLGEAVVRLLKDDDLRQRLGAAARRRAQAAFDRRTAASGLAAMYAEVIDAAGS
jgi:glycosyltransferase involved in cell wall biosynthesis